MENLKNYLKIYCCKEHTLKSEGYFNLLSIILAKKQPKIAYGTRVEVDACSH
jgi:hypothetical protein